MAGGRRGILVGMAPIGKAQRQVLELHRRHAPSRWFLLQPLSGSVAQAGARVHSAVRQRRGRGPRGLEEGAGGAEDRDEGDDGDGAFEDAAPAPEMGIEGERDEGPAGEIGGKARPPGCVRTRRWGIARSSATQRGQKDRTQPKAATSASQTRPWRRMSMVRAPGGGSAAVRRRRGVGAWRIDGPDDTNGRRSSGGGSGAGAAAGTVGVWTRRPGVAAPRMARGSVSTAGGWCRRGRWSAAAHHPGRGYGRCGPGVRPRGGRARWRRPPRGRRNAARPAWRGCGPVLDTT